MKKTLFFPLLTAALFSTAAASAQTQMTRQTRFEGQNITGIAAGNNFDVEIYQSDKTSASIEIPAELEKKLIFNIDGNGVVTLGLTGNFLSKKQDDLKAKIYLKNLKSLKASSNAEIKAMTPFTAASVVIDLSSSGKIDDLELTASYKTGAWSFSLRERPQATLHTAYVDPAVAAKTAWVLRHRLMAEYAVAGTGLKPYVFVELTQTLNAPETVGNYLEKMRSSLGAKYAFNKRSSLEFYYRFDYKISDEPVFDDFPTVDYISSERESHHIIGLEYGYKF